MGPRPLRNRHNGIDNRLFDTHLFSLVLASHAGKQFALFKANPKHPPMHF